MNRKSGHCRAGLLRRVGADAPRRSTRRALIFAAAAWPVLAWTGAALPQSKQAPALIGWLSSTTRESGSRLLAVFKEALAALGWKDGSQFVIEARWADGQLDRMRAPSPKCLPRESRR